MISEPVTKSHFHANWYKLEESRADVFKFTRIKAVFSSSPVLTIYALVCPFCSSSTVWSHITLMLCFTMRVLFSLSSSSGVLTFYSRLSWKFKVYVFLKYTSFFSRYILDVTHKSRIEEQGDLYVIIGVTFGLLLCLSSAVLLAILWIRYVTSCALLRILFLARYLRGFRKQFESK